MFSYILNLKFRVRAGFWVEFQIRAGFRIQNEIFLRVKKIRIENFRAESPSPLPSPAYKITREHSDFFVKNPDHPY